MNSPSRIDLPKPEGHNCFACGSDNPIGLNLSFYALGSKVCADVVLGPHHVGWENIAHGGIISTVLDEIMGWTVLVFRRAFFVTRNLEVRFLKPVSVETPLRAEGEIETDHSRGCHVTGALLDAQGNRLAAAKAEMVFIPEKRLGMLPEDYQRHMLKLFRRFEQILS